MALASRRSSASELPDDANIATCLKPLPLPFEIDHIISNATTP